MNYDLAKFSDPGQQFDSQNKQFLIELLTFPNKQQLSDLNA